MEGNKKIKIVVHDSENYCYDLTHKVVALLFNELKDSKNKNLSIENKKSLIKQFEKVMKCLRIEALGIKRVYEKKQDDLEIISDLSECLFLKDILSELINDFQKFVGNIEYVISIECEEKLKGIIEYEKDNYLEDMKDKIKINYNEKENSQDDSKTK